MMSKTSFVGLKTSDFSPKLCHNASPMAWFDWVMSMVMLVGGLIIHGIKFFLWVGVKTLKLHLIDGI